MKRQWWQDAIIYQIYLRSFKDSNNDGIGDFKGLISKLDYLSDLGITALWVSPHYESPMDDNGYDISDFFKVSEDYGTLKDVKEFINEAHKKNIKVIFDLVLNHTSDEHEWFKAAKDPVHVDHHKYHDYYIWQKPKYDEAGNRQMPTQWLSWFGGPVWEYNDLTDEYYLHIFSKKMPDLNWRNNDMKRDLKDIAKWWINQGVDGFRVDASNHLEKNWDFPEGHPGYEHFSGLPMHHKYLEDFGIEVFKPNNVMSMGEAGNATKEEALKYCGFDSNEFDMLIHFGHCWADLDFSNQVTPGKWSSGKVNVRHIKSSYDKWFKMLNGNGWNLIYWHNHDQPRVISHYGNDTSYRVQSGKMLAYSLYLMPGTPIIYQGEEIGMVNVDYEKLTDFRDVEVYTEYKNFIQAGATHELAMNTLRNRSRDNARTPFQWDESSYAGFSKVTPWIKVNDNYKSVNLNSQMNDRNSIFETYKELIKMRKAEQLNDGIIEFIDIENEDAFIYINETSNAKFLVISNFREKEITVDLNIVNSGYRNILYNYSERELVNVMKLQPYEALVYKMTK